MDFKNYNRYNLLKRKTVTPKLDQSCIGPCSPSMIKLGLCKCEKSNKNGRKKSNAFFQYRFWITVAVILMLVSWFFHISLVPGIIIVLLTYVYFQYFKNERQSNFQR